MQNRHRASVHASASDIPGTIILIASISDRVSFAHAVDLYPLVWGVKGVKRTLSVTIEVA